MRFWELLLSLLLLTLIHSTCLDNQYTDQYGRCQYCHHFSDKCTRCYLPTSSSSLPQCTQCMPRYFIQPGTNICEPCTNFIPGCALCSSTSVCTTCGLKSFYLDGNVCSHCSESINNCSYCQDSSTCIQCDAKYYLENNTCHLCQDILTRCQQCASSIECTSCLSGLLSYGQCTTCSTPHCSMCTVQECTECVEGYFLDNVTCSQCISNCQQCLDLSTCARCSENYYYLSNQCQACSSSAQPNCTICEIDGGGQFQCLFCQDDMAVEDGICKNCSHPCKKCDPFDSTICTSCYRNRALIHSTHQCVLCRQIIDQCIRCESSNGNQGYYVCTLCNQNFSLNVGFCVPCDAKNKYCDNCTDNMECTSCTDGYYLEYGDCLQCDTNCLTCENSSSQCLSCPPTYYLINQTCLPCQDSPILSNCIECSNINNCTLCNLNHHLIVDSASIFKCGECPDDFYSNGLTTDCQQCTQPCYGCIGLSTFCTSCITGYSLYNGTCLQICGDNLVVGNEECDEGSYNINKGCSSSCQIVSEFSCTLFEFNTSAANNVNNLTKANGTNHISPLDIAAQLTANYSIQQFQKMTNQHNFSICSFSHPLAYEQKRIWVQQFQNKIYIEFQITPNLYAFESHPDGTELFQLTVHNFTQYEISIKNGILTICGSFKEDQTNQQVSFELKGQNISTINEFRFFNTPVSPHTITLSTTTSGKPIYFYESYSTPEMIYYLSLAMSYFGSLLCLIGIFSRSLAQLQFAVTCHFIYTSLIFYDIYLYPPFQALIGLQGSCGYNYQYSWSQKVERYFKDQGVSHNMYELNPSQIASNYNIMVLGYLIPIIIGLPIRLLKLIPKKNWKDFAQEWSSFFLEEILLYMSIFNMFLFLINFILLDYKGVQLSITGSFMGNIVLTIGLICTSSVIIRFAYKSQGFGRFYKHIKPANPLGSKFYLAYPITIISSILLMAFVQDYTIGSCMPAFFFMVYILLYKPYQRFASNLRAAYNFLLMIIAILMQFIYQVTEQQTSKGGNTAYYALILMILIALALIFTVIEIVFELIQAIKNRIKRKQEGARIKKIIEEEKIQQDQLSLVKQMNDYHSIKADENQHFTTRREFSEIQEEEEKEESQDDQFKKAYGSQKKKIQTQQEQSSFLKEIQEKIAEKKESKMKKGNFQKNPKVQEWDQKSQPINNLLFESEMNDKNPKRANINLDGLFDKDD